MDYIEREAAINKLKELAEENYRGKYWHIGSIIIDASIVLKKVKRADVAPVIRAKWIIDKESKHEKIAHCSHCGKRPVEKKYAERGCGYVIYHCYAILTDFCPNCGAKMDGETN